MLLHRSVLAGKAREIYVARVGLLAVTPRVLDLFKQLVPGQFDSGPAEVEAHPETRGRFHWIRPRHHIGSPPWHRGEGERCPRCGRFPWLRAVRDPARFPGRLLLNSFGEHAWDLALVGEHPQSANIPATLDAIRRGVAGDWKVGVRHHIAASGGLYAALYNAGVKGLAWPDWGPYISVNPDEPTWEDTRRFADLFTGSKDRIMRKKGEGLIWYGMTDH
jgi:hypothetical protein